MLQTYVRNAETEATLGDRKLEQLRPLRPGCSFRTRLAVSRAPLGVLQDKMFMRQQLDWDLGLALEKAETAKPQCSTPSALSHFQLLKMVQAIWSSMCSGWSQRQHPCTKQVREFRDSAIA